MEDYRRVFDAWEAGGIRGLVFGRLLFADDDGNFTVPAFESSLEPYRARGLDVSRRDVACDPGKERLLHAMLEDARRRGWGLMIFCPGFGTAEAAALLESARARLAAMEIALDRTVIRAPCDGVVERRHVELGGLRLDR